MNIITIIVIAFIVALIIAVFDLLKLIRNQDKDIVALALDVTDLHERDDAMEKHKHLRGKVVLPAKDEPVDTN